MIDDSDAVLKYLEEEGIETIDAKTIPREKKENMNTL